jgi:uncharacterized membrane protein
MDRNARRALGLAAFIGGAGVMHFAQPQFFDAIVPEWMPGEKRTVTQLSGVAELTSGVLIAVPRTRRLGGLLALLTFVGVFPANIQCALDGGMPGAKRPFDTAAAAWLRLPLQVPLIRWAWKVHQAA